MDEARKPIAKPAAPTLFGKAKAGSRVLGRIRGVLDAPQKTSSFLRYGLAVSMILLIALLRAVFAPALAPGAYYYLYIPPAALAAYAFGLRPALLAIVLGGLISYYAFAEPVLQFKADMRANLRLAMFLASSGAVVALIGEIRRRLNALSDRVAENSLLSQSQARLFREHAERTGNHMQLLAALLAYKTHEEEDTDYARVLMNASSRTMLISRMHRGFVGGESAKINFHPLAERLADELLEASGRPPLVVRIEGELSLIPEHATSLALILLESISASAADKARGEVIIQLSEVAGEAQLLVTQDASTHQKMSAGQSRLVHALAEQLNGRLVISGANTQAMLRFSFPTALQPLPIWEPLTPLN